MANPYRVVAEFEELIAAWAGSRYAVAVESCTAALFLSCVYKGVEDVTIPCRTYPSVPCSIIHAGGKVRFLDVPWEGIYELSPYEIYDGALRFCKGMFVGGLHCISFHSKKHLPIGRGGMVLTDDKEAYHWLRRARFDGRREVPLEDDSFDMLGWNMYMTPEQAVRGIQMFNTIDQKILGDLETSAQRYPDLSKYPIYS